MLFFDTKSPVEETVKITKKIAAKHDNILAMLEFTWDDFKKEKDQPALVF